MANKDDYLTEYRKFFEYFAETVNPHDQLPVKLACYKLVNVEVVGGIIDWTTQYLTQKRCPEFLIAPLIRIVIDEIRKACKKHPVACGFNTSDEAYEPLKLMQCVMAKTNEVCLRYLDNSMLCSLPSPGPPYNVVSVYALKNLRRKMEDRHVVIHDLNTMFNVQKASPSSYYAVFDGHAGHDAAAYSCAHLHQFLAENKHFIHNPEQALIDAFCKTDALFIDKCKVEKLSSGTTAVCALLRPKEKTLYIAWVGDSQALLVNQGKVLQCVAPHKPSREDEKNRIEQQGGVVLYWGTWRVNGQLAVSRAIGDAEYKPYVTATPDIQAITLTGGEDFLILACDGLWDFLSEDDAALAVYNMVCNNPDDTDSISHHLAQLAKQQGSTDNISVIVVFLREPSKVAADAHWANRNRLTMEAGLDNANNATNNPFANSNGAEILQQKDGFLLNLTENFKQNGSAAELSPSNDYVYDRPANGKRTAEEFDEDEDMGPETDVDALDDGLLSPASEHTNIIDNKNLVGAFDPFTADMEEKEKEKASLEMDLTIQKQQTSEFDPPRVPREETPTPPADEVHDAGIEENVADSGEDSEDEWNYFKGDTAESEQVSSSKADQEVAALTRTAEEDEDKDDDDDDNMSQLNPNAAEFVPISSPTRNVVSPACRTLMNEQVISQSPRRATPSDIDINLPNERDFEKEVKNRPSDLFSNGQDDDDSPKLSSQEVMENLLNGKNIDEIEFHPGTPLKSANQEEFHFGPNATPFSTPAKFLDQSEAGLSTKAVFGDESSSYLEGKTLNFETSFTETTTDDAAEFRLNKPTDPMSMSFYQEEDKPNPLDLNKVHDLSECDDIMDKVKNNSFNETMSDMPEHEPLRQSVPVVTDLDKPAESGDSNLLCGVTTLSEASEPRLSEEDIVPLAKSPILMEASKAPLPITPEPNPEEQEEISPVPRTPEAVPLADNLLVDVDNRPSSVSPAPLSPFETSDLLGVPEIQSLINSDVLVESSVDVLEEERATSTGLSSEFTEDLNNLSKSEETTRVYEDEEICQQTLDALNRPDSRSSPALKTPEPTEELLCQAKSPEPANLEDKSPIPTPEPTTELCEDVVCNMPEKVEDIHEEFFPICQKTIDNTEGSNKASVAVVEEEFFPICSKPQNADPAPLELIENLDPQISRVTDMEDVIQEDQHHVPTEQESVNLSKLPIDVERIAVNIEDESKQEMPQIESTLPELTESVSKSPEVPNIEETQAKSPIPSEDILIECQMKSPELGVDVLAEVRIKSPEPIGDAIDTTALNADVLIETETKSEIKTEQAKSPFVEDILVEKEEKPSELILDDLVEHVHIPEPNNDIPLLKEDLKIEPESFAVCCNLPDNDIAAEPIHKKEESVYLSEQTLVEEIQKILDSTEAAPQAESDAKSPETIEESLDSEKRDLDSPVEDITSSVKDDNSITPEIIEEAKDISTEKGDVGQKQQANYTEELSSVMQDKNELVYEKETVCQISSTPNTTFSEQTDTESVRTADVNSILERSNMPEITSPLSPTEQSLDKIIDAQFLEEIKVKSPLPTEDFIKTELITPQYPEETVITPSEETKEEISTVAVEEKEAPVALPEVALEAQEKENTAVVAVAAGAAAAAVTAAAVTATVAKEKKSLSKPLAKVPPTSAKSSKLGQSPTKTLPSKPTSARTTSTKPTVSSPTKPVPTKTTKTSATTLKAAAPSKAAPRPSPRPKTETATLAPRVAEKKPMMNGDVKAPAKAPVAAKKPISSTTTRTQLTAKSPSAPKPSPTKTETKTSVTKSNLTSTKVSTTSSTLKPTATSKTATASSKPRPTSLTGKPATGSSSSTKTTPVSATKTTVQSKTSTTAMSPKTTTARSKPTSLTSKVPTNNVTSRPRTTARPATTKGPDTEKEIKESVNKQLTASRSSTTRTTGTLATGRTTTTVKKTEMKSPSTRTTTTKTTITSMKPSNKKPTEITRITAKKTVPTKTTVIKTQQNELTNGITTIVQETTTILSTSEPQLIKDMSPLENNKLIVENSQLSETTKIAD